ncbi:MAG: hypothetical protein LH654_10120 [Thermoleophilia bacterium]|nr:hypothetical protein [Thermoleophilia bacterium]
MTTSTGSLQVLHGSHSPIPEMRMLRAGPVFLLLDGVDLRYLRIGGTELIRRVYAAVRDEDWDTVPGVVSGMTLEEGDGSFRLEFDMRHARRDVDFSWHGVITGDEDGRVEILLDGRAEADLAYNRIGLCVHHPWRETAGASFTARTPAGELVGAFPDLIGPQAIVDGAYNALFAAYDRLEVDLESGGSLLLEFEEDLWETEDHRNWTDANFKTYSTPIALGFPHRLAAGEALRQRLVITPIDVPATDDAARPIWLTLGEPTGTRVPVIGLGFDRDGHRPDDHEAQVLADLSPRHLRIEVRLDAPDWRESLSGAQATAGRMGSALELALMFREEHVDELTALAEALAGGPAVDRVLVTLAGGRTATPEETTPAGLVDVARVALAGVLPGASFIGGTEIYFTEINRTRPDHASWDGVCYSLTPQVHAFTDVDVVENLDAQAETVRSARAVASDKPITVSPITMRRRYNFHAAGDPPPTPAGALPDSVDVRQSSLFGAAWTAGSLKYISEAGAATVTYYESTGWRGVIERASGSPLPELFASRAGAVFPLYHPLADVIGWSGAEVLACESSSVLSAIGFAVRTEDGAIRVLIANLTPGDQDVVLSPLAGEVQLRRLSESTATEAGVDPRGFRGRFERAAPVDGRLAVTLWPYELVRIDPA